MRKTKKQKGSISKNKVQKDKNQIELSLQVKESVKWVQSSQLDKLTQAVNLVQSVRKLEPTSKPKSSVKPTKVKYLRTDLSKKEKGIKLKTLSLEGVKAERYSLKETPLALRSPKGETSKESFPSGELLFDNRIHLITVEELAVIFRLAPQTIRNWVAQGKLPYVKIGKRDWFLRGSVQEWLNRKEKPQWQ